MMFRPGLRVCANAPFPTFVVYRAPIRMSRSFKFSYFRAFHWSYPLALCCHLEARWGSRQRAVLRLGGGIVCHSGDNGGLTAAEEEANRHRWVESGHSKGNADQWKWSLNWDQINSNIIIGSCPRSPSDVDSIIDEAGATAILSVQSDLCLEALKINYPYLKDHGISRGVLMTRIPIRDFDHGDQTLMLPEAVRTLALLVALNYRVYVHCTAGINRASLTVLGYLTFVQGKDLYTALKEIKQARKQANPYVDCWKNVKAHLLDGRSEEVIALSKDFYLNKNRNPSRDAFADWVKAEDIVIKELFERQLACSLSVISSITDLKAEALCSICVNPAEMEEVQKKIEELNGALHQEKEALRNTTETLEAERVTHINHVEELKKNIVPFEPVMEIFKYKNGSDNGLFSESDEKADMDIGLVSFKGINGYPEGGHEGFAIYEELLKAKEEIKALKMSLKKIAFMSAEALSMASIDSSEMVTSPVISSEAILEASDSDNE